MKVLGEGEVKLVLFDETKSRSVAEASCYVGQEREIVSCSIPVQGPKHWSAEDPALYHLVLVFGQQVVAQRVGFRKVEMKAGLLTVNGDPILIRGANRHEHHPKHGRTVPRHFLRKDLILMKRSNINTIRTCHQPSHPDLYDLADELGLYIIDEADLECHGWEIVENANFSKIERSLTVEEQQRLAFSRAGRWLTDKLEWKEAVSVFFSHDLSIAVLYNELRVSTQYLDRAYQMVERDKNHPSVIMWSLGNEAFQGRNFQSMYGWVKAQDPTRPIHYEGDNDARIVDIVSTMYPPLSKLKCSAENWNGKKSIILCEFLHAMGNGPGSIKEYFDMFYEYPCLQGGCIWEWANHGLLTHAPDGTEYYGYGGDFGEVLHDSNFVMDGILSSEHEPTPALWEYRKALEPVHVVDGSTLEDIQIINRYDFITLDHLQCLYRVVADGFADEISGEISLPVVEPGQKAKLALPALCLARLPEERDAYLEISFRLKKTTAWAKKGFEIAWSQVPIGITAESHESYLVPLQNLSRLSVVGVPGAKLEIRSQDASWIFDQQKGRIAAWFKGSQRVFHQGPVLGIYRAPIDNDIGTLDDWTEKKVRLARPYTSNVSWRIDSSGCAEVQCIQRVAPPGLEWALLTTTTYTFMTSKVLVHVRGEPKGGSLPLTLPRLGLDLALDASFDTVTWFGRGPGESYKDKKYAQRFGRFSHTLAEISSVENAYEVPQEYGNRTDTRWVQFSTSAPGGNLLVTFPRQSDGFNFQASHFAASDIENAKHPFELKGLEKPGVLIRLDHDHHGLGSESCGRLYPKVL